MNETQTSGTEQIPESGEQLPNGLSARDLEQWREELQSFFIEVSDELTSLATSLDAGGPIDPATAVGVGVPSGVASAARKQPDVATSASVDDSPNRLANLGRQLAERLRNADTQNGTVTTKSTRQS